MTNIKAIADATATVSRLIGDLADRTDRGFLETVSHGNPADHAMEIALQRITEESHIISIWGERGSGKSTVLSSCFKQLKDDRRFALLPPLSPELFPTIADVVDIVLATIATHYESFLPPNSDEIAKAELRRSLALARQSAALDNLPVERLVAGMTTATDLERLVERSAGGTERLWLSLQRLVAEIVTADDKRRALIIGVDDADLSHHSILEMARVLRNIASLQGVIVLLTARPPDALLDVLGSRLTDAPPAQTTSPYTSLNREVGSRWDMWVKAFPQHQTQRISPITWEDVLGFTPRDKLESHLTLQQCLVSFDRRLGSAGHNEVFARHLMLNDPRADRLRRAVPGLEPLPRNLRALSQLDRGIRTTRSAFDSQEPASALAGAIRHIFSSLRAVAGRRSQFSLDIAAPVTTSHGTSQDAAIAEFDFSCAYSIIARTSNSWHPSKPGTDRNSFAVTKLAQLQAKWDVTDTRRGDPYCRPNEFPALLAIQGIVTFSDLMERAPDNSKSVFALTMQEYAFLQEVRVAGSGTDDRFLSLPLADTLRTTMMSVEAWNMIVDRVSRDSLTLQQTMALTISASIDIYYRNQWFDGDHASTDYNEALSTLDEIAACCIDSFAIRGRSKGGSREHLVDWYSRWIPAHWHEAVFDADQIRAWTSRLMVTVGPIDPESSGFSGFVYAGDLASRVRIASEEAGTAEQIARWRWMGGYRTYVDTAALTDLPSTFRSALCKEYQEHQTRIALGGFAAREIHADYLEAPSGPPPGHAKRSSADEKFDQALTDYTVQRLQRWKRS